MPTMNYAKLRGRTIERGLTQKSLTSIIGASESQFFQKMSGKYPFKQTEIELISDALQISADEIGTYFFARWLMFHNY